MKAFKQQVVIKTPDRRIKTHTRHVKDGFIRSADCPHGVECKKCFVALQ